MGACTFETVGKGKNAKEAFQVARDQARHEHGHGGYSGTIAEKSGFIVIVVPRDVDPVSHARALLDANDARIDDKWGPAGCVALGGDEFLFFGWASS